MPEWLCFKKHPLPGAWSNPSKTLLDVNKDKEEPLAAAFPHAIPSRPNDNRPTTASSEHLQWAVIGQGPLALVSTIVDDADRGKFFARRSIRAGPALSSGFPLDLLLKGKGRSKAVLHPSAVAQTVRDAHERSHRGLQVISSALIEENALVGS